MEPFDHTEVFLQTAVIVPERMAGDTEAAGFIDMVYKILGIHPAAGIIFNPPCRDIPLKGKELNTHKNGKTGPV